MGQVIAIQIENRTQHPSACSDSCDFLLQYTQTRTHFCLLFNTELGPYPKSELFPSRCYDCIKAQDQMEEILHG